LEGKIISDTKVEVSDQKEKERDFKKAEKAYRDVAGGGTKGFSPASEQEGLKIGKEGKGGGGGKRIWGRVSRPRWKSPAHESYRRLKEGELAGKGGDVKSRRRGHPGANAKLGWRKSYPAIMMSVVGGGSGGGKFRLGRGGGK